MKTKKKMASTAKKSAKIITMAASMAATMNLSASDARAMQCAFYDMTQEFGDHAIIIDMNPFDGFFA